jgi:hypothetical protein
LPFFSKDQRPKDQRRLVRRVVVHHEMNIEIMRHVDLDLVEEFPELGGAVARETLADDASGEVESGEQGGRALAGIVIAAPRRLAGRIGSIGWLRSSA